MQKSLVLLICCGAILAACIHPKSEGQLRVADPDTITQFSDIAADLVSWIVNTQITNDPAFTWFSVRITNGLPDRQFWQRFPKPNLTFVEQQGWTGDASGVHYPGIDGKGLVINIRNISLISVAEAEVTANTYTGPRSHGGSIYRLTRRNERWIPYRKYETLFGAPPNYTKNAVKDGQKIIADLVSWELSLYPQKDPSLSFVFVRIDGQDPKQEFWKYLKPTPTIECRSASESRVEASGVFDKVSERRGMLMEIRVQGSRELRGQEVVDLEVEFLTAKDRGWGLVYGMKQEEMSWRIDYGRAVWKSLD